MSAIPASIFDVGQKDQSRNMVHAKIISPHFVQCIFSTEQMQEMSSASIHTFYPFELQKLELQNGQTTVEERGSFAMEQTGKQILLVTTVILQHSATKLFLSPAPQFSVSMAT